MFKCIEIIGINLILICFGGGNIWSLGDIVLLILEDVKVLEVIEGVLYVVLEWSMCVIMCYGENDFLGWIIGIMFVYFYVKDWEMF